MTPAASSPTGVARSRACLLSINASPTGVRVGRWDYKKPGSKHNIESHPSRRPGGRTSSVDVIRPSRTAVGSGGLAETLCKCSV